MLISFFGSNVQERLKAETESDDVLLLQVVAAKPLMLAFLFSCALFILRAMHM